MTTDINESDILTSVKDDKEITLNEHMQSVLREVLADMPALDQQKVQAVLAKLKSSGLEILGNDKEREECAKRIAQKIITENANSSE